ncbi:sensor histidine kinase [Marivita sp. S2033]|uniref:sensor histidine kinase n=1 Tax=Marivita sp. S2033 TaxID=3373187 RepID=UPI003982C1B2
MSPDRSNPSDTTAEDAESKTLTQSLVVRIALLLSLALLPIGLVAMSQSWRAIEAANENLESSLHARTSTLVEPERRELLMKMGVAKGLAETLGATELSTEQCTAIMQRVRVSGEQFEFVGVMNSESRSVCNSAGTELEFTPGPRAADLFQNPEPFIGFSARGSVSELPVITVLHPIFDVEDMLTGFVALSFAAEPMERTVERIEDAGDVSMVMFNKYGEVLSSSSNGDFEDNLPEGLALEGFVNQEGSFFTATSRAGDPRLISVIPILPGEVYALGSWGREALKMMSAPWFTGTTLLFPFVMWAVGIIVAVISLNRLVLRHISDLGRRMRRFADERNIQSSKEIQEAPNEIQTINETFESMADQLLRDEADLQNAIYEREVLLKEVYHRVKNNLQLISSIINMQVRQLKSPEAVTALRQFQDRVNSLASVHRALYQEPSLTKLRVDVLIGELVTQVANIGAASKTSVDIRKDLEKVTLIPDHASPLAMATTEALSNVFKYGGPGKDGVFRLRIALKKLEIDGEEHIRLSIGNSVMPTKDRVTGTGLGRRLIAAFSSQLEADVQEDVREDWHDLTITFPYQPYLPEQA